MESRGRERLAKSLCGCESAPLAGDSRGDFGILRSTKPEKSREKKKLLAKTCQPSVKRRRDARGCFEF